MSNNKQIVICLISVQIAFLGLVAIDSLHILELSILRLIVGFILLTFVPGFLVLLLLRIKNINIIECLVYSAGISISFIMFIGFLINSLYYIGLRNPITIVPLLIGFNSLLLLVSIISYYSCNDYIIINDLKPFHYNIFIMALLPILSIIGGILVYSGDNKILMLLMILISCYIIKVSTNKQFGEAETCIAIYFIVLSILFHVTSVSSYPMLINVDGEFGLMKSTMLNGYWNLYIENSVNSMLSIVLLAPIYSILLDVDLMYVIRFIYPMIFSITFVSLFLAYKSIHNNIKHAFFSIIFLISLYYFYFEEPLLRRQMIAILFLSLIILLVNTKKINKFNQILLLIVFSFSLVVSHYATAYIYLMIIVFSLLISLALQKVFKFTGDSILLRNSYIVIFCVLAFSWYIYTTYSSSFSTFVRIFDHLFNNISEYLNPEKKSIAIQSALGAGYNKTTIVGKIYRILQYITQLLIIIGVIRTIIKQKYSEFYIVGLVNLIILIGVIILPFISLYINMPRIYFITLFFLSPFFTYGILNIFELFRRYAKIKLKESAQRLIISIFLVIYFMFNIGFVFEIMGYNQESIGIVPYSPALSYGKIDTAYYTKREVASAIYISSKIDQNDSIYADKWYGSNLISAWCHNNINFFPKETIGISKNSYIFLREWNLKTGKIILTYNVLNNKDDYYLIDNSFYDRNLIYDNGGSEILSQFKITS